ncbi:PEPxxWA-CTERM sorting domain-containing protein [uncultured Sphingomonas sp.]|uniref:PEPxxWA-CTERM sorting domain-containing protein n=1 Tax=uncultured Sphingomonas sp. TaxID=158754 RepID=UPI0025E4838F|nr:PEPxxWA-CTERM sorting domain-containing protein [uncultured Sphingomonas sp.]
MPCPASLRTLGATIAVAAGLTFASAAAATTTFTNYTYNFTNAGNKTGTQVFTGNSKTGSKLNVKVSAWHATPDTAWNWNSWSYKPNGKDSVTTAKLATMQGYGLGVLYGNDSSANGTHQIDNVGGGTDFIMLQFDKAVTLSSLSRNVYAMRGVTCCDSDASIYADVNHLLGDVTSKSDINLGKYKLTESAFTDVAGGSRGSMTSILGTQSASVWLISAALHQSNDGFKLGGLTVAMADAPPPAAVPEPASWAMMIVGFGAVGGSMRGRRRTLGTATAAA